MTTSVIRSHLIQRQVLHINVNGPEANGPAVQRTVTDLCRNELPPAIDGVLQQCDPREGHLVIEQLDIDAGDIGFEQLGRDLPERIATELERVLRAHVARGQVKTDRALSQSESVTAQHLSNAQAIAEALVYFLETGSLPWSFQLPQDLTLEQAVLSSWSESGSSGGSAVLSVAERRALLRALSAANSRRRLVLQFTSHFMQGLLARIAPASGRVMAEFDPPVRDVLKGQPEYPAFERQMWDRVFRPGGGRD